MKPYRVLLLRVGPPGLAFRPPGPPPSAPPLGILSLASSLRSGPATPVDVSVRSLSADVRTLDEVAELVEELQPDLLGLSALTLDESRMKACARLARAVRPEVHVVVGGPLATLEPGRCFDEPTIDGAVIGEGERTLVDLVEALAPQEDPAGIPGLWWREGNTVRRGRRRPFVHDLDELPIPAWDLVDLRRYTSLFSFHDVPPVAPPYAPIVTSRGCPWRCSYCHNLFGREPRLHSPMRVVDEMELLATRHGVGEIHIVDDVFNVDADRMMQICDEIERRGLDLKIAFPNGLRGDILTREQLKRLESVGCYSITFALETASPRIQKLIRKNLRVDRVLDNARQARDLGMITSGYIMLGFPTETREEMETTVRAIVDSAFDLPRVFTVCPFPGTDLFDLAVQHGFEPAAHGDEFDYERLAVNASDLSDDEMHDVLRDAHRRIGSDPTRRGRLRKIRADHPHSDDPVFQRSFWTSLDHDRRVDSPAAGPPKGTARADRPDVLLLFPPASSQFQYPELGMPQLTGHLRSRGFAVEQRDLNVEAAFHRFTGPETIAELLGQPGWERVLRGPPGSRPAATDEALRDLVQTPAARRELFRFVQRDLQPPSFALKDVLQWLRHPCEPLDALCRDTLSDLRGRWPRLAGLSVASTTQVGPALRIAAFLRAEGCEFVTLGGPWARAAEPLLSGWSELFDHVDGVVTGEGEQPLAQVVGALCEGRDPAGIPGLAVRRGGRVVATPAVAPAPLADLAPPDFAGLDLHRYPRTCLPIRSRRTCPWGRCTFCHHLSHGVATADIALPAEEIVRQMTALHDGYGVREFELANLATPLPELRGLAETILDRGLDVRWSSLARVEAGFDTATFDLLAASGCGELSMGLESVSPGDLARMRKGIDVDTLRTVMAAGRDSGVGLALFVLNLPDQQPEDLEATLDFCTRHADDISDLTVRRFALSSGSPAFTAPAELRIVMDPTALGHLDVFDLPFRASWPVSEETYVQLSVAHLLPFTRRHEPLSLWSIRDTVADAGGSWDRDGTTLTVTDVAAFLQEPRHTLGLLAASRASVLLVDDGPATDPKILGLARYSKVLDPSRRVVVISPSPPPHSPDLPPYVDEIVAKRSARPFAR